MARRSPRAPTEPFAAAPHALGERRAASRGRYPPEALLRHARHACAVAGQRESGDESAALREIGTGTGCAARFRSLGYKKAVPALGGARDEDSPGPAGHS